MTNLAEIVKGWPEEAKLGLVFTTDGECWCGRWLIPRDLALLAHEAAAVRLLIKHDRAGWIPQYHEDPRDGLHYYADMADFEGFWPTLIEGLDAAIKNLAALGARP